MKKICTKCRLNKVLEEYYGDNRHKDGKYSECKSCTITKQKEYNKSDKGKAVNAEAKAEYNKSGKGRLAQAKYDKSDKGKTTHAKHMKTDKGKATAARSAHNRRTKVSNSKSTLNDKEWNYIVFTAQDGKCACCRRTFTDELKPTRDHVYPVELGGDFTKENVQALCQTCNSEKGTTYIEYRTDRHREIIATLNQ